MSSSLFARWTLPALGVAVLMVLAVSSPPLVTAQDSGLVYRVVAPASASEDDTDIVVLINAEGAENLGAFEFQLTYDPDLLQLATDASGQPMVQRGDFLGSTGREVNCPDPVVQSGVVRLLCTTLRMEPAGPDGSGTLASINFNAVGTGTAELSLDRARATTPDATEIAPISMQSAVMEIKGGGGMNWLIWGPVIIIGVLIIIGVVVFVAMRARSGGKAPAAAT